MELFINMALLTLLAIVTIAISRQRNLFGAIILAGVYSFLMATLLIALDAVDVAMTEASVGAGVSTVFLLAALHLTQSLEQKSLHTAALPAAVAAVVGAALVWGTPGLSPFGTKDAVIHRHVAPKYLNESIKDTGVPNVVTSTLADYRGYDTLGETTVIFTAGIGVMLLLRGSGRRRRQAERKREHEASNSGETS
jgi:multicomponent Na+:H+ antiporter subunit B